MSKTLKAIFFDIDDTLYSTSEFADLARRNSIGAMITMGLNMDFDECFAELQEVIHEFSSNYDHHYDHLLSRIPTEKYNGINPSLLVAAAVVAYHNTKSEDLKIFPGAFDVLQRLAQTDILIGIISAGLTVKQAEKIVRLNITDYINKNAIFISEQVGVSKPNVKLYQRACDVCNVLPQETMYVGNSPHYDIDPANEIGMITVCCRISGKHLSRQGNSKPDFEIKHYADLLDILRRDFSLPL